MMGFIHESHASRIDDGPLLILKTDLSFFTCEFYKKLCSDN